MTIATHTGATEQRPCSRCGATVEHRESALSCHGTEKRAWFAEKHSAPCGLPCMGGGVHPRHVRHGGSGAHGFQDRCPRCGPLRVLPEVVAEMRAMATPMTRNLGTELSAAISGDPPRATLIDFIYKYANSRTDTAQDLLRALDEIDKLRAELAQAREALGEAREQATWARQELMDREVAEEEKRAAERRSPPMDWAWLDEAHRSEVTRWVRKQAAEMRENAAMVRVVSDTETALRHEALAASLLALVATQEAPSPLTPEQREALGREALASWNENEPGASTWEDLAEAGALGLQEDWRRTGEHMFLRGLGAGRDLLMAGQLLRRLLICDEIPKADREIPPGLQIAVGRVVGAVERLGYIPPDREPPRSTTPATDAEREEAEGL